MKPYKCKACGSTDIIFGEMFLFEGRIQQSVNEHGTFMFYLSHNTDHGPTGQMINVYCEGCGHEGKCKYDTLKAARAASEFFRTEEDYKVRLYRLRGEALVQGMQNQMNSVFSTAMLDLNNKTK